MNGAQFQLFHLQHSSVAKALGTRERRQKDCKGKDRMNKMSAVRLCLSEMSEKLDPWGLIVMAA